MLYRRPIPFDGFENDDGLYDIQAHLIDTNPHGECAATQAPAPLGGCLVSDPTGPMVAHIYPRLHIKPGQA